MRLLPFAAALILTGPLLAADPQLVSLAMPDSQTMAGVNVEQVMLSPLGQYLLTQPGLLSDEGPQKLMEAAGFDPRRDLREILVSSNAQPGSPSVIVLARGTFDVPKMIEAARAGGATIETYKGVSIIGDKQGGTAFPDSTLAITGGVTEVRAAIDRLSAPTAISSALAVQVNQLSTTEDAWFVLLQPLAQLQPPAQVTVGASQVPFALLSKVQQVSGGVKFGANVLVSLQAVSQTDQDAASLAVVLKSLPAFAQMAGSKSEITQAAALLKDLNVTTDGQVTKISLSVPEQQIEAMIQAGHTRHPASNGAETPVHTHHPLKPTESSGASARIRVGSAVQKAKLLQQVEPVYPPLALQARISGVVRLNAIIGKDGTVQKLTVVSGHPLLIPPAMEAVRQWVYEPTLLNGQAAEVVTQIEVSFSLEQ